MIEESVRDFRCFGFFEDFVGVWAQTVSRFICELHLDNFAHSL